MILINNTLINILSEHAKASPRLRMNYNFHQHPNALFQRMLNAIEPFTYIRPHKHENPDKSEVFLALKGTMAVFTFDNQGEIVSMIRIEAGGACPGVEIAPRTWHTIISLESGSVAYEAKDGPYEPGIDKCFASWAPEEGSHDAMEYLQRLKDRTTSVS
jgi:cupin fold WbuC family metalloprotein